MALNDITFVKGQGGLGRALAGEDHISGLIYYIANGSLPSGFSSTDRIKTIYSVADAEALGIASDYSDATPATGTITVTNKGADGDTLKITVTEPNSTVVTLGTYTKVSGDSTVTLVAAALKAMINAGTVTHGYSADNLAGVLTITAPKKLGTFLNSGTPITVTIVGTIAQTLVQFASGTDSLQAVWHYHIAEYFRVQPKGVLYLNFCAVPGSYDFAELVTLQNHAVGKIRQVGIYKPANAFSTANLTAIQTQCDALAVVHKPISSVLLGADISGTTDLSTLSDLNSLTAYNASAVIGQDGGGLGDFLFKCHTSGKSVTCLGATLGAVSLASVSQDIAWKAKFNMSNGVELDTLAFANGTKFTSVSDSQVAALDAYRYIFLLKNVGSSGSFFNDSHTAISISSDYAYIENNRTIDKAIRGAYVSLLPEIAAPIQLNRDGTLSDVTIGHLTSVAAPNLDQMVRDGDLSNYSVTINPTQDVLATSKVIIAIALLPKGVSRYIQVNIGFTTSL